MTTSLTKRVVRQKLGADTDAEVARFFGISAAAVSQWPEDQAIPELRQLQAGRKRPDLFGPEAEPSRRSEASPKQGDEASATGAPVQQVGEAA